MIICIDRFGPRLSVCFILQCRGKPLVGIAPGHDTHSFVEFASLEIQYELPRQRFQSRSLAFNNDVFSVGKNAKLRQWRLDLGKLLTKRSESTLQPMGRHSLFDQLFYGSQPNQVAEVIEAVSLVFLRRDET